MPIYEVTINKTDKMGSRFLWTTVLSILITSATLFAVERDQTLPKIKKNIIINIVYFSWLLYNNFFKYSLNKKQIYSVVKNKYSCLY